MLPFLTDLAARQGKPWHAWRMYAFVAFFGVVTVALRYVDVLRSPWVTVVAFIIGTMMTMWPMLKKRRQRQQHQ
jgi:Flp pilus assembly protein TadB